MKKATLFITLFVLAALIPGVALAASPWTEKTTWSEKVNGKLEFGIKNTLGGITEVVQEAKEDYKQDKKMVWRGLLRGTAYAAADMGGGLLHVLTFPFPQIDIPLPENGISY